MLYILSEVWVLYIVPTPPEVFSMLHIASEVWVLYIVPTKARQCATLWLVALFFQFGPSRQ